MVEVVEWVVVLIAAGAVGVIKIRPLNNRDRIAEVTTQILNPQRSLQNRIRLRKTRQLKLRNLTL